MHRLSSLALVASVALTGWSTTSCTSPIEPSPIVTLHVRALLTSTHPGPDGQWITFHAPLSEYSVVADAAGKRVEAAIDRHGYATLPLEPGKYVVNTTLTGACPPTTVVITLRTEGVLTLPCIAP